MEYRNVIKNVLDRHQDSQGNMSSDSFRDMLSVEISSGIELEKEKMMTAKQKRDYEFIQNEMSQGEKEHLDAWSRGKAKDNPLSIEMWKGYNPNEHFNKVKEEELSKEYLDFWTCDLCGKNTHEVEYDYLGNNRNHLGCELKAENESIQKGEQMELFPELVSWIYESPDGGKTITKRKQGEDYTKRILVTDWEAEKENIVRRYN
tara:strand:+ start:491 stop:1102 length:612 start_codon:yes stop_codon:yes gene_type:complete